MLITLRLFGFEVVAVECSRGGLDDVDLGDYQIGSDTERADVEAWREDVDEDAPHRPRILVAGRRRRSAPVIAIGSKHSRGDLRGELRGDLRGARVDVNRASKGKGRNGFGFALSSI